VGEARRGQLAVRTIVVGWRAVMRQIRADYITDSRSVHRVTAWALRALDNVQERYGHDAEVAGVIRAAREEVLDASHDDLAGSGEQLPQ
jgi:hypothetical protein